MGVGVLAVRVNALADLVWDHLSWEGMEKLCGGPLYEAIEFDIPRNRVGSTKTYRMKDGAPLRVKLLAVDESERTYRYRLIDNGSLPVTDYTGYVRVTPCGPQACHVNFRVEFQAVGISDDEFHALWMRMATMEVEDVRRRVETTPDVDRDATTSLTRRAHDTYLGRSR
jgi:hypothetical protein